MRIACLHTMASNIAVFEAARADLDPPEPLTLTHAVRTDLLVEAEAAGGLTPRVAEATAQALVALGRDADAVLLTCSTLGPAVARSEAQGHPFPILRVDAALAEMAVQDGGPVTVLCTVETTIAPTRALFAAAAHATGATITIRLVPGAWAAFRAGEMDRHFAIIADAAAQAVRDGAARVALAQASMAGAARLVSGDARPLTSPRAGLAAAVAAVGVSRRC
jgi:hypothetical protein